eukprot:TCONS_00043620-protein
MNSFMILILFVFPTIKPQCDYDDQYQWYVIGIYSACYNETNRTELHHLSEALDKSIKFMWEYDSFLTSHYNYKYISIDVCDDFNNLSKIVESIYLNESLHYNTRSEKLNKSYSLSSVIAIYAEGPAEMMN